MIIMNDKNDKNDNKKINMDMNNNHRHIIIVIIIFISKLWLPISVPFGLLSYSAL